MQKCVFCRIVKGEIPADKIYEAGRIVAFLDASPINKGHSLVVTKDHYSTITEVPDNLLREFILSIKEVANAVYKAMSAEGYNLVMNNYRASGQVVDHVHMHIVPRFVGDGLKHWPGGSYRGEEAKKIAEKIRSFLK